MYMNDSALRSLKGARLPLSLDTPFWPYAFIQNYFALNPQKLRPDLMKSSEDKSFFWANSLALQQESQDLEAISEVVEDSSCQALPKEPSGSISETLSSTNEEMDVNKKPVLKFGVEQILAKRNKEMDKITSYFSPSITMQHSSYPPVLPSYCHCDLPSSCQCFFLSPFFQAMPHPLINLKMLSGLSNNATSSTPSSVNVLDGDEADDNNSTTRGRGRKRSWTRAVFSSLQRKGLEKRFLLQKYITKPDRRQLAASLGLSDAQVKVWFQNRRMKWRHAEMKKERIPCNTPSLDPNVSTQPPTISLSNKTPPQPQMHYVSSSQPFCEASHTTE